MPRQRTIDPQAIEIPENGPIVLVGQPASLRGDLYLRNSSPERVVLRKLPLASGEQVAALRSARPGFAPAVRLSPGIIRPGHTGPVSLSVSLDPYTPPGEYHAEMDMAGRMVPVVMRVTERVDLRISPAELVIENRPDQTFQKQIVVTNTGNVPLTIGKLGSVFLDDELLICRTLRAAAAAVGDDLRPLEEYLARILLEAKHVAESSGILRVHSKAENEILQPGEVRPIDLEIRVPAALDRRGRYRGVLALYTANLTFLIVPTSGPSLPDEGHAEESAPKPRSRKRPPSKINEET